MRKLVSICLALTILVVPMLTGCGSNNEAAQPTEVTFGENVVAMVGNSPITAEELDVYLAMITASVQASVGNAEGWEDIVLDNGLTARDTIIEEATNTVHFYNAVYNKAREEGIFTDEDATNYFDYSIANLGGETVYDSILESYGLNEESFKKMIYCEGAINALAMSSCTDEDAERIYTEEGMNAKHVLILFEGRETEEAAYDEAMNVYNKAIAGEDFDALIEEYNEDPGQVAGGSYTFTPGEMVDEFYQGTKALEIGGVSEPVKTSYGYHVIKRGTLPEVGSDEYLTELEEIKQIKAYEYMSEENEKAILESYPITLNEDALREIDLSKFTITE